MKKSLTIITLSLVLALSLAGCGKKNAVNDNATATPAQQTDVSDMYSAEADIDKVDGEAASFDNVEEDYTGTLGDYEMSIGDAKIVQDGDSDILIISFEFKNNSDEPTAFTAAADLNVYQDDSRLPGAVVTNIEGVNLLAMAEQINKGESITVQRAYSLRDKSQPVDVELREFNAQDDAVLVKTFTF